MAIDAFRSQQSQKLGHEGRMVDRYRKSDMAAVAWARVCVEMACCTARNATSKVVL